MDEKLKESTHIISQKIDSRLRMLANCDQEVNAVRAMQCGNLATGKKMPLEKPIVPAEAQIENASYAFTNDLKKEPLKNPSSEIITNVFLEISPDPQGKIKKIKGEVMRKGNLVSAQLPLTELKALSESEHIVGIEGAKVLKLATPIVTAKYVAEQPAKKIPDLELNYAPNNPVLVGIIDVGGFDFSHPDFLDEKGETRFLKIWDQGTNFRSSPKKFKYGAEFTRLHLNNAIKKAKAAGVPATELERQSSISVGSHGTHVASIAAGNTGVCPHAQIVGVTIALEKDILEDRRKSFYDSACLVHAVTYLLDVAAENKLPISINISLGTNGHAHDGSDITSRWIDSELNIPGRCICIAAGNAGQEKALSENDLGYTMGRIHTKGKIDATGLTRDVFWTVVGDGRADFSENELEIWYAAQDRISVMIKPPDLPWIGPVSPREYIENNQLKDGSYISIYNDLYHFANGNNYIGIYLSPNFKKADNRIPVKAGTWQVRLIGTEIRHGEFDGWIERDDPRSLGITGNRQNWNFPSYFSERSNVDNSSISSLACSRYVIAVGNCDMAAEKVHITSSQGPTRDKRNKPEVLAPGTDITAAKGFTDDDNDRYISMTGTSMASPYVCGVGAWMLSIDRNLSAAQIQGIIIRTSKPLPGDDYNWKDNSGFGIIDVLACLDEAKVIRTKKDITHES